MIKISNLGTKNLLKKYGMKTLQWILILIFLEFILLLVIITKKKVRQVKPADLSRFGW